MPKLRTKSPTYNTVSSELAVCHLSSRSLFHHPKISAAGGVKVKISRSVQAIGTVRSYDSFSTSLTVYVRQQLDASWIYR